MTSSITSRDYNLLNKPPGLLHNQCVPPISLLLRNTEADVCFSIDSPSRHERENVFIWCFQRQGLPRDTCKVNVVDVLYTLIYWSGVCWVALSSAVDDLNHSLLQFHIVFSRYIWCINPQEIKKCFFVCFGTKHNRPMQLFFGKCRAEYKAFPRHRLGRLLKTVLYIISFWLTA